MCDRWWSMLSLALGLCFIWIHMPINLFIVGPTGGLTMRDAHGRTGNAVLFQAEVGERSAQLLVGSSVGVAAQDVAVVALLASVCQRVCGPSLADFQDGCGPAGVQAGQRRSSRHPSPKPQVGCGGGQPTAPMSLRSLGDPPRKGSWGPACGCGAARAPPHDQGDPPRGRGEQGAVSGGNGQGVGGAKAPCLLCLRYAQVNSPFL